MHLVKDWQTHIVTFRALIAANMDQYPISELCKCTIESIATEIQKPQQDFYEILGTIAAKMQVMTI